MALFICHWGAHFLSTICYIFILPKTYILLQLVSDIFLYLLFVASYCIHIISSTPKMSIPVLVFHIRILFKYHQTTFSFEISHNLRNTILGWYRHKHMYMVFARFRFYDLDLLVLTQFSQHYPYIRFDLSVDYLAAVFWCKNYMVFAIPFCM